MTGGAKGPFLEVEDLHAYYGVSHVVRGVSLTVAPGEAVSLMGRNGMGKTTTLRSILRLIPSAQGWVRIAGRDVTRLPAHRVIRQGIAFVPEGRGVFPNLSVVEHLRMAARPGPGGRVDWDMDRVLELFPRLAERRSHYGTQLSGGEQQMLTVGRALTTNPSLLILDEATEGLAPLIRQEIWRVIRLIKETGISIIIVDKNVRNLMEVADRSVILVKGEVVFDGPNADLLRKPDLMHQHLGV